MKYRSKSAAALIVLLALCPTMARVHDHTHHDMTMDAAAPLPGESIYNLDSKWTTEDDATVALGSLRGAPVVAAMGTHPARTSARRSSPT